MTKTTKRLPKGESKVRDYLAALADPSVLINQAAVEKARARFEKETDPNKKLTALKALREAETPDISKREAAFVEVALEWAEGKGFDGQMFIDAHGVPRNVLRAAGFDVRTGTYKERVTTDVVRDAAVEMDGPFEAKHVAEITNASVTSTRNALNAMVEEGLLEVLPKELTGRRGKPAVRYQKV